MKKHYVRLALVIGALILVAFVLGAFFFTYVKIQHVNDEYMKLCSQNALAQRIGADDGYDMEECIKQAYSQAWRTAALYTDEEIGFSGAFVWYDGEKKEIESDDFVWVYYKEDDRVEPEQFRILPVEGAFEADDTREIRDIELYSMCDRVFIYSGAMYYRINADDGVKSYQFGTPHMNWEFDGVAAEQWAEGKILYGEYIEMGRTRYEIKLNEEASKILNTFMENQDAGTERKSSKEGWFSSYYCTYCASSKDITTPVELYGVYFYNPMHIVLKENVHVYILFALVLLALEAMVMVVTRRMYVERKNYEMRSQRLTRSIAHDLKTPLAVTKAYVENWEYIDEEDRAETAESINSEVDNMTKMVNTLLELSNLDSGAKQLKMEEVELLSLTKSVYRRIEPLARERGMEVRFITDKVDAEYLVSADLEMMKIVIGNFLSNAVKYGEKHIRITIENSGRNVLFDVTNDGATISKKEIKKIWDPFYKTDKARTNRLGSSGVGLAVNKSILELHKAKFGCRSENGETSFWFEMRRVSSEGEVIEDGQ